MAEDTSDPQSDANRPADHLIALLTDAVSTLPQPPVTDLSDTIASDSKSLFEAIMATVQTDEPADPTSPEHTDLSAYFHQRELDCRKADSARRSALRAANAPLEDGSDAWMLAVSQYNFAIAQARSTLATAIDAAKATYAAKYNRDSTSRAANLYYELKEAVANAVQAYDVSAASAGGALAADAGTLLAAYATYVGASEAAQAQYQVAAATAEQTFWQGVEGVLDAS